MHTKYPEKTLWRNSKNQFHRMDGPAVEWADGTKYWYQNGQLHRIDGPAVEYSNGSKEWFLNDQRHRMDGPAIQLSSGGKEWWLLDKLYFNERSWEQARNKLIYVYKPPVVKDNAKK